jgi:predicted metal-dependent TIM-barrel fold hydrolase
MTYKMMMRAEDRRMPVSQVMMNELDSRLIETVVRDGFVAGVSVATFDGDARDLAKHLLEVVDAVGHADRIVLNSGLSASQSDVVGVPKTIELLMESEMPDESVRKLAWDNAADLFGHSESTGRG